MHIQVVRRLSCRDTSLPDQVNRLDLELTRILPSLHLPSPAPENTLSRVPRNRQQLKALTLQLHL